METLRNLFPQRHPCYAVIGIVIILASIAVSATMLLSMMTVYHGMPPMEIRHMNSMTDDYYDGVFYRFVEASRQQRKDDFYPRPNEKPK